jgi:prephenate dehydrogenase
VSPDVLVLATGVDDILARIPAVASMLRQLDPALRPLVLDVGSVKTAVVAAAEDSACPRFIGGHPMAGRERSGLQHACASLFEDRPFVLCPSIGSSRADLLAARRFVRAMGARPLPMSAALHDRCVALVSHVPHLLAVSLMEAGRRLERELGSGLPWKLAAGAWRDATRVAMADPHLWAPIFVHNKAAIVQALDLWLQVVSQLRAALQAPAGKRVKALDAAGLARLRHRIERHLPPQS